MNITNKKIAIIRIKGFLVRITFQKQDHPGFRPFETVSHFAQFILYIVNRLRAEYNKVPFSLVPLKWAAIRPSEQKLAAKESC